jgi:hypothetical protein
VRARTRTDYARKPPPGTLHAAQSGHETFRTIRMVGVAQLVEHLVVVQDVAGSSPVTHPPGRERPAVHAPRFSICGRRRRLRPHARCANAPKMGRERPESRAAVKERADTLFPFVSGDEKRRLPSAMETPQNGGNRKIGERSSRRLDDLLPVPLPLVPCRSRLRA